MTKKRAKKRAKKLVEKKATKKQRSVADTLRRIRLLFDDGVNWIKHQETDQKGSYCLLGAIKKINGPQEQMVTEFLRNRTPRRDIPDFNDSSDTQWVNVENLLLTTEIEALRKGL